MLIVLQAMSQKPPISVFWMRRDLRLFDNAALYHALKSGNPVLCLFVFDKNILDKLDNRKDKRLNFIHQTLLALKTELNRKGSDLLLVYDTPENAWKTVLKEYQVTNVFINRDYEPYALTRDKSISKLLNDKGIRLHSFKDQVIFEPNEVTKSDGTPYLVFTPFSKKWLEQLNSFYLRSYPTELYETAFWKISALPTVHLKTMGFEKVEVDFPHTSPSDKTIGDYEHTRDFPAKENGTSRLGLHLRFGTVSIRQLATRANKLNQTFLKELIWREFFMHILYHFPHTVNHAFRKEFDNIQWRNDEADFEKWCEGKTGYPMVDAGMRELNETGFMHNRVRMVVASFLSKHLLIDWRWGERYFAEKLLDFDLSANVGNWQWAAGCGCDAAPYFRVFSPHAQAEKFDASGEYIRKWVPELETFDYPQPMVEHKMARERALKVYTAGVKEK